MTLQVPVEPQSFYWATYSAPAASPPRRASPTGAAAHSTQTATPVTGASPTATPGGTATATPTP